MIKKVENEKIKGGKKIRAARKAIDTTIHYPLGAAIGMLQETKFTKFDPTLEIAMMLGIDPKYSDQNLRGAVPMPNGIGKSVKIAVFAKDAKAEEALKAGADIVGSDDLVEKIKNNEVDFDVCIATPDTMGIVGKVAKILGPKGKMPNPKLGTVTTDIKKAIETAKSGQVEFKADKAGIVHAGIGKLSFDLDKLVENAKAFIDAIIKAKPSGAKGNYLKALYISSTMGPSVKVDLATIQ